MRGYSQEVVFYFRRIGRQPVSEMKRKRNRAEHGGGRRIKPHRLHKANALATRLIENAFITWLYICDSIF